MSLFDWGLTKPGGGFILLITTAIYFASVWLSAKKWILVFRKTNRWYLPSVAGLVVIMVMIYQAGISLSWQTTSAHYQEKIHIPAVITVTIGFMISYIVEKIVNKKANK